MNKNDMGLVLIVFILVSGCVTQNAVNRYLDIKEKEVITK